MLSKFARLIFPAFLIFPLLLSACDDADILDIFTEEIKEGVKKDIVGGLNPFENKDPPASPSESPKKEDRITGQVTLLVKVLKTYTAEPVYPMGVIFSSVLYDQNGNMVRRESPPVVFKNVDSKGEISYTCSYSMAYGDVIMITAGTFPEEMGMYKEVEKSVRYDRPYLEGVGKKTGDNSYSFTDTLVLPWSGERK